MRGSSTKERRAQRVSVSRAQRHYAHDAMERFYDDVEGGYAGLIMKRGLGFPSVHAEADFKAPIRYGDTAVITGVVKKLGATSVTFFFEMHNQDGLFLCTTLQTHVCTDITKMVKAPSPPTSAPPSPATWFQTRVSRQGAEDAKAKRRERRL